MSWDIYGEPLRRGHCEVHPHVHEEYPCSVFIADKRSSEHGDCRGVEHDLYLAREHIEHLKQERDALATHVESARPMVEAYRSQIGGALWALDGEEIGFAKAAEEWLVASPETYLARLKAQWQAEALDEASNEFEVHERARMVLHWKAQKIRQQAEADTAPKPETQP